MACGWGVFGRSLSCAVELKLCCAIAVEGIKLQSIAKMHPLASKGFRARTASNKLA